MGLPNIATLIQQFGEYCHPFSLLNMNQSEIQCFRYQYLKSVRTQTIFLSLFSGISTNYGDLVSKSPYLFS